MPLLSSSESNGQLDVDADKRIDGRTQGVLSDRRVLRPTGIDRFWPGLFRLAVLSKLSTIRQGTLFLVEGGKGRTIGCEAEGGLQGELIVRDPRFYQMAALGGANGAAEAYIRNYWDSPNLTDVLRVMARNLSAASRLGTATRPFMWPLTVWARWSRRNSISGSRKNISAHYDLSNEFFAHMLDQTMTYSAGVFPHDGASLAEASIEKYDRICRQLGLARSDHVLEIGTGWGGFAEYAAREYGCRVTTTTISEQQHAYAKQRFGAGKLTDRITLLMQDYRALDGQYDKLVSIEMIEAVGESYLDGFFAKCSSLLKPAGAMALQAITIPDQRYESYRHGVDFIQQYIFPGGFLPSVGKIAQCVGNRTDFRLARMEDFSGHYAKTLSHWRDHFEQNLDDIRLLGFDERFIRTWRYYLAYCEAGFSERQVGVGQFFFVKPKGSLNRQIPV